MAENVSNSNLNGPENVGEEYRGGDGEDVKQKVDKDEESRLNEHYSKILEQQKDLMLSMSTRMAEREAENANLKTVIRQLEESPNRFAQTPGPHGATMSRLGPAILTSTQSRLPPRPFPPASPLNTVPQHSPIQEHKDWIDPAASTNSRVVSNSMMAGTQGYPIETNSPYLSPSRNTFVGTADVNHSVPVTTVPLPSEMDDIISRQRNEISTLHQRMEILRNTLEEVRKQRSDQTELLQRERQKADSKDKGFHDALLNQRSELEREFGQRENEWKSRVESLTSSFATGEQQFEEFRHELMNAQRTIVTEQEKRGSLQKMLEERDNYILTLRGACGDAQKAADASSERAQSLEIALREREAALTGAQRARDGEVMRAEEEKNGLKNTLESRIHALEIRLKEGEALYSGMKNELGERDQRLRAAEGDNTRLRQELEQMNNTNKYIENQLHHSESVNARLEKDHSEALNKLLQCERELERLGGKAVIDEKTVLAVKELENRLMHAENESRNLGNALLEARNETLGLNNQIGELRVRAETAEREANDAKAWAEKVENTRTQQQETSNSRISALEKTLENARKDAAQFSAEVDAIRLHALQLQSGRETVLQQEVEQLKQQLQATNDMKMELGELPGSIEALRQENEQLRLENSALKSEGQQLRSYNLSLAKNWSEGGGVIQNAEPVVDNTSSYPAFEESAIHIPTVPNPPSTNTIPTYTPAPTAPILPQETHDTTADLNSSIFAADSADVTHLLAVFQHEIQRVRNAAAKEVETIRDSYAREQSLVQEKSILMGDKPPMSRAIATKSKVKKGVKVTPATKPIHIPGWSTAPRKLKRKK